MSATDQLLREITEAERVIIRRWLDAQLADLAATAPPPQPSPPVAVSPPPAAPTQPAVGGHPGFPSQQDEGRFYDGLRDSVLGPTISPSEFKGCDAITRACAQARWGVSWTACAMATAYLETAHTMLPIKEYGGASYFRRMYDIEGARPAKARELGNLQPGDGARFAGRGYVQLTGRNNYARAGAKLGVELITAPDRALDPDIAAQIMVRGMEEGWFTGKMLADYLPRQGKATRAQFKASRRIINGQDRADDIAGYALQFQDALVAGSWLF